MSLERLLLTRMLAPDGRFLRTDRSGAVTLGTDVGGTREENQDRLFALTVHGTTQHAPVFYAALSDGMGGMAEGSACATITLAALADFLISNCHLPLVRRIEEAAKHANRRVHSKFNGRGGATLTLVAIEATGAIMGLNVGDSRIYAARPNGWGAETIDDTLEARYGGEGRGLIQFVGLGDGLRPHLMELPSTSRPLYLTSDGVHFADQNTLYSLFENAPDARAGVERSIALARWLGSPDNATIVGVQSHGIIELLRQTEPDEAVILMNVLENVEWRPALRPDDKVGAQQRDIDPKAVRPRVKAQRLRSRNKPAGDDKSPQLKIEVAVESPEDKDENR